MPITIGGHQVASMNMTFSWGLNPASATVRIPGVSTLAAGAGVSLSVGGLIFSGVVSSNPVEVRELSGRETQLQVVDNRLKLMWDDVYGAFNNVEVREDNPATPGIDRQKRFWHILPKNYDVGLKTWTDQPYTAADVIHFLIAAPTVAQPWGLSLHSAQQKPVYDLDFLKGAKLGNALHEITEQQGLVFTLVGSSQLLWARKGEGSVPSIPSTSSEYSSGDALSHNDTQIRVVGDRNRYQDMPISLEPAWVRAYEEWWLESNWLAEVDGSFGPFAETLEGAASRKARALSVTVRELVAKRGNGYADYRLWGEVSRMEIPVWTYLQDIVFKAYGVPAAYTIRGLPRSSTELREGLLAAVTFSIDSGVLQLKSPREFYPDDKAFVIVQGQQLSLLDPRSRESIHPTQLANARTKWSANNRFNVDPKNYLIIFQDAVFVPGAGDQGLFVFPNQSVQALDPADPLYGIAVPNANVSISPAAVRAVMVFDGEIFTRRFGSGVRKGPRSVPALNYHALLQTGRFVEEVKYADGKTADAKANEYASVLVQQPVYLEGRYKRNGTAGTALNGVIDRVSVVVDFAGGISELVELTKERPQSNFEHERELDRRQRGKELFPGQKKLREETDNLRAIARASHELSRTAQRTYANLNDVMQTPVMAVHCSPTTIESETPRPAGTPLFVTEGKEDGTSKVFAGVTIADQAEGKAVALATQGVVPTRVKGPFKIGDQVSVKDSEYAAGVVGMKALGTVMAAYAGDETVLAPVRLGGGSGGGIGKHPFQVIDASTRNAQNQLETKVSVQMGWLSKDIRPSTKITITGIGEPFVIAKDDVIWLEVRWPEEEIDGVEIKHGPKWDGYDDPVTFDDPEADNKTQKFLRELIAYTAALSGPDEIDYYPDSIALGEGVGAFRLIQRVFTNLVLCQKCFEANTVVVTQPYHAPGPELP